MSNRLAEESSPYLLQHADNPVDWFPWGPEALERAREEERPILLSIGYAACHWCHVMEHESFEDPAVAAVMNDRFVNIKVDREERPDLDGIYMKAVQAIAGQGGWPLTAFLTPDGRPFYGGTYFPPEPRHGMPSFRQILDAVHDAWTHRRDEVEEGADRLTADLRAAGEGRPGTEGDDAGWSSLPEDARRTLGSRYDPEHGGFGRAPKFPQPVLIEFLLGRGASGGNGTEASGDPEALRMAVGTLRAMARGGMRDQVGGGFHRYSVDARWLVPHFEKMLYDNALLARVYALAWSATGDDEFRRVAEETLDDLLRTFRTDDDAFVSAHDADSEGAEGTFYLWSPEEIDAVASDAGIPPQTAERFRRVHGVTDSGNFEGRSILHLPDGLEPHAARWETTVEALRTDFAPLVEALRDRRADREPPLVDSKVLAAWNAFAIRAFAEAGARFGRADLVEVAVRTARFLLDHLRVDGRLHRVWPGGEPGIPAFLDDHAALGNALLTLHAATLDPAWLSEARACVDEILDRFVDEEGRLWDTAHDAERLVVRPRDPADSATPSGTSLTVELLLRAGHLFDERAWTERANRWIAESADACARFPSAFGRMLAQMDRSATPPVEIVVAGPPGPERDALLRAAWTGLHPARTIAGHAGGLGDLGDLAGLALFAGRTADAPMAWVCRGHVCDAPTRDPDEVRRGLGA